MPTQGNKRVYIRLDPVTHAGLRAYAAAHGIATAELVRGIILDWKREVAATQNKVAATLDRIDALVRTLQLQASQVSIAGKVDTQKTREDLLNTAIALIKESVKLSENEDAAKNARARIEAMRLANQASRTAEAILRGLRWSRCGRPS